MTLMPEGYRPRLVDEQIEHHLRLFGAVCVEGPKFCGKTWASRSHSNSAYMVGDPSNNFQNRRLAEMEVTVTLSGEIPHLIDEWQDVPGIWDAVRNEVDQTPDCGRFILTGSSTPCRKGIMRSLSKAFAASFRKWFLSLKNRSPTIRHISLFQFG